MIGHRSALSWWSPVLRGLGVLLASAAVLQVALASDAARIGGTAGGLLGVLLALLATLPLLVVNRWPRAAPLVAAVAMSSTVALRFPADIASLAVILAPGLAAYWLGGWAAAPLWVASACPLVLIPGLDASGISVANTLVNLGAVVLAILVGAGARVQTQYAAQLEERTRELEQLRDVETREAVAQERLRIAREVHDVVGHALAAITLHARVAARRMARDPDGAARSLAEVAELATSALAETRDAVGPLRDGAPAELHPEPRLDDLDELVRRLRASGLAVKLDRRDGDDPIPAVVQAAAYRIVQESLSNVVRHAGRGPASVAVHREPGALRVEVCDAGPRARAGRGNGHGLIGMRERAVGLGGTLDAGPDEGGGWRVHATLPIAPSAR